jgi:riboflavin kinase/FMN adenylyltransferase
MHFEAHTITGAGRGRKIGIPTLNLDLSDIPATFQEGIYACYVHINSQVYTGALHYGPRPVFKDSIACEVHLLDTELTSFPTNVQIQIVQKIREVQDFPSQEALIAQIEQDIGQIQTILSNHRKDL